MRDQENDIWLWHSERQTLSKFTFSPANDQYPVWTPDGQRIIFNSNRATGSNNLFWQAADGSGTTQQLTKSTLPQFASAISPDGTRLVFRMDDPKTGQDLMLLSFDRNRTIQPLVQTPFNELNAEISPDGHWFAYQSNQSGRYEIYVRPFPNAADGQWQISTAGGGRPLWSRNGQELFFLSLSGTLMAVRVETGATFQASAPTTILDQQYYADVGRTYDISPDGQRFLMVKADTGTSTNLMVVLNWFEDLKQRTAALSK